MVDLPPEELINQYDYNTLIQGKVHDTHVHDTHTISYALIKQ